MRIAVAQLTFCLFVRLFLLFVCLFVCLCFAFVVAPCWYLQYVAFVVADVGPTVTLSLWLLLLLCLLRCNN